VTSDTWDLASRYFSSSSEKLNAETDRKPDTTDTNLSCSLQTAFSSRDRWYSTSWVHTSCTTVPHTLTITAAAAKRVICLEYIKQLHKSWNLLITAISHSTQWFIRLCNSSNPMCIPSRCLVDQLAVRWCPSPVQTCCKQSSYLHVFYTSLLLYFVHAFSWTKLANKVKLHKLIITI